VKIMTVEAKSRTESTRDASTERDEEVNATISLAIRRRTFARKLMRIAQLTIDDDSSSANSSIGNNGVSSSKVTALEGAACGSEWRW